MEGLVPLLLRAIVGKHNNNGDGVDTRSIEYSSLACDSPTSTTPCLDHPTAHRLHPYLQRNASSATRDYQTHDFHVKAN
mgnify:CR=1 FL=1